MKVTIYTIPDCPFCKQTREYLTKNNITFEDKDVQANKDNLKEMLQVSNNFAGVPFAVVEKDNGEKVMLKGFTQKEFDEALGLGTGDASAPKTEAAKTEAPQAPASPATTTPATDAKPAESAVPTPPVAPVVPEKPATPVAPEPPKAPSMDTPAMPKADAAPAATPATPPAADTPADPQQELSGLLKDLESKAAPESNGGMNNTVSSTPAAPTTPQAPASPVAEAGQTTPPAKPAIPDFNK